MSYTLDDFELAEIRRKAKNVGKNNKKKKKKEKKKMNITQESNEQDLEKKAQEKLALSNLFETKFSDVPSVEIDVPFLLEVLGQQATSTNDVAILEWIKDNLNALSQKMDINYEEDSFGNIYVTKGSANLYPCVVSHVDQVHDIRKDYKLYVQDTTIFAFSNDTMSQVGTGGDNKCGIYICFEMLKTHDNIKVVFFRQEEIGTVGSKQANMTFFNDCAFVLQPDRRGSTDFITVAAGTDLSGTEFQEEIHPILSVFGYHFEKGSVTDVMALKDRGLDVCACNISCGYYNPHTDKEIVEINALYNCMNVLNIIIAKLAYKRWEHTYVKPVYNYDKTWKPSWERTNAYNGQTKQQVLDFSFEEAPWYNETPVGQTWTKPKIKHLSGVQVDDDIEEHEDYLEEIDIVVGDLMSCIQDYMDYREKIIEKQGKL